MMSNLNIKLVVLLMACLCLLMALSCVSASEISGMGNVTAIDDTVSADALAGHMDKIDEEVTVDGSYVDEEVTVDANYINEEVLTVEDNYVNDDELPANDIGTDKGTFNDLNEDFGKLEGDGQYYIEKDYVFNEESDNGKSIININTSYVTIYGNGHIIDANGSDLAKFIVSANNVIIHNLIFKNFNASGIGETSHIQWNGNNGHLVSCEFYNNAAPNGGAIAWNGNKGYIDHCLFENSTALNRGGAIYVTGKNISIEDSTFRKFISPLSDEAIYFSSEKGQSLSIKGSIFSNDEIGDKPIKALWDEGCIVLNDGVDLSCESFDVLCKEIENLKSGDYYILERDYVVSNTKGDLARNRIINIAADNVTIDGNGHIINGGGGREFFALFNITGNNVKILNLNIINFRAYDSEYIKSSKNIYGDSYNHLTSPIEWQGDNGFISNCLLYDNVGDFGGAIYWTGNNGRIEKCIFDDNAADFGGAIYIAGNMNDIVDCIFNASYATNHYEAIYFKNINNPILTLNNCSFESTMHGAKTVDAENGCEVIYDGFVPHNMLPAMKFKELCELLEQLKDGDTFTFDRDCLFETFDGDLTINANNITINGNGYKVYGNDSLSCLFNIFGDNVRIIDLTFDFLSIYYDCPSFITLNGNGAVLENCTFIGNAAKVGGTVNWNGDNGLIDNCLFINNTARAISMDGTNNAIRNCVFNNTFSKANRNQVIYYIYRNLDRNGLLTIDNCSFEGEGVKIWIQDLSDVLIDGKAVPVTIDDLYDEISNINDGEVYDIYRNYFSPSKSLVLNRDNITINGNSHTFYVYEGILNESIFYVEGNGIKISGLTILDHDDLRNGSLINWIGDDGVLTECSLIGNLAEYGGAIFWTGNNGLIAYNEFFDNRALYAGGSIFIGGEGNKISNCYFENSGANIADEAIYIDYTRKHFTLEDVLFDNCHSFIDGYVNDIDLGYLSTYQCVLSFADEYINLYPLLYAANLKVGVDYYNDYIYSYGNYNSENGEFTFNLVKEFSEFNITYAKAFVFKNMFNSTTNDLFKKLSNGDYEIKFTITKTCYVDSISDYIDVMKNKLYSRDILKPVSNILLQDSGLTIFPQSILSKVLNVVFTKSLIIDCAKTWNLSEYSSFGCVNIQGCGSVIRGSFDESAEDKWVTLIRGRVFSASNMTIEGFNTAVENNGGVCIFANVLFNNNRMDYWFDRDWGAAILNTGWVYCVNCTFTNNYACNGGAIFNQGTLVIENSHFRNNTAYGEGPSICVGDGGKVTYNGENITENDQVSVVHFAESMSIVSSTIVAVFTPMVAYLAGVIFGIMVCNPFIGAAVGFLVGAAVGGASAAWVISEHYDVNYNRLDAILSITIPSAIAGAMGGLMAGGLTRNFRWEYNRIVENHIMVQYTHWEIVKEALVSEVLCLGAFKLLGIVIGTTSLTSGISYYFTND